MRILFCLPLILVVACSSDPMNGRLTDTQNSREAEQTNYPPEKLKEQTFVLNNPIAYESKHAADKDELHTALKRGAKLASSTGGNGLIAVPVNTAQGSTTIADIMLYDPQQRALVNSTVYRLGYTPPEGQSLSLDGISATFQDGE
jgi:hypothetical protein